MARPEGFLKLHLIPFFISLIITCLAFVAFPLTPLIISRGKPEIRPASASPIIGYYPNFKGSGKSEQIFQKALGDRCTMIFLGSSELSSTELLAIPYNFYNKYLNYPALCVGHDGNQSLNMLSFLASNRSSFKDTRLVILFSPTWFVSKAARGTSLESFLEFNSDRFLTALYQDSGIQPFIRDYIFHYVARNMDDISSPSAIQKLISYQYAAGRNWFSSIANAPFVFYYSYMVKIDTTIRHIIDSQMIAVDNDISGLISTDSCASIPCQVPWDSLYNSSLRSDLKRAGNNNWGIDSGYFKNYVSAGKFELSMVPRRFNREYRDFCALLDFLSTVSCKPLIIIQPLNPYVYEGLAEFKPLMDEVADVAEAHHFPCLNLFVSDTAQYAIGDLKDVMHMGNPGWYKVDRFVIENYFPGRKDGLMLNNEHL